MTDILVEALTEIIDAISDYLPPDGIEKEELINRVIYATDNPVFNAEWHLKWDGREARGNGDLYEVAQLSDIVWVTVKNGTEFAGWKTTEREAKQVAQNNFRSKANQ